MTQIELDKLLERVEEEFRIIGRPSADNSRKMLELLKDAVKIDGGLPIDPPIDQSDLNVGDKVHYVPFEGCDEDQMENGYVKEIPDYIESSVRVVFNWFGDSDNPLDYTSQLTDLYQIKKGWVDNPKNKLSLTYNCENDE